MVSILTKECVGRKNLGPPDIFNRLSINSMLNRCVFDNIILYLIYLNVFNAASNDAVIIVTNN